MFERFANSDAGHRYVYIVSMCDLWSSSTISKQIEVRVIVLFIKYLQFRDGFHSLEMQLF